VAHFSIQEFKKIFNAMDAWIRSEVKSVQLKKWKKPRKFQWIMTKLDFSPRGSRGLGQYEQMAICEQERSTFRHELSMVQDAGINLST